MWCGFGCRRSANWRIARRWCRASGTQQAVRAWYISDLNVSASELIVPANLDFYVLNATIGK
jgi:hypothetical protein